MLIVLVLFKKDSILVARLALFVYIITRIASNAEIEKRNDFIEEEFASSYT